MDILTFEGNDLVMGNNDFQRLATLLRVAPYEHRYLPNIGIDIMAWIEDGTEYTVEQFTAFLLSEASKRGFDVTYIDVQLVDNELQIKIQLGDGEVQEYTYTNRQEAT